MSMELSRTGDIRESEMQTSTTRRCIKTSVACRSCTPGTRQRFLCGIDRRRGCGSESWAGAAGVHGGRYRTVAAFVECCARNGPTQRFDGCPPWTLFSPGDVHDRLRQATACEWSGLDLCLDCLRPACTAVCVSWVAPTLPRSP
jgi:hypothetical protein